MKKESKENNHELGVIPESFNKLLKEIESDSEDLEIGNVEKLTEEEYSSIIDNYKNNKDAHLNQTINWLDKYIEKVTKDKYVKNKKVEKMISKIANDLGIKSHFFNTLPF
ncbi:MAG: hypothetical protein V3U92_05765 [Cellulophaga sp.]